MHTPGMARGIHMYRYWLGASSSTSGPGCSELMTSLDNVALKYQTLISETCQYFLLKKCEKLLLLSFFQQKYQCIWL